MTRATDSRRIRFGSKRIGSNCWPFIRLRIASAAASLLRSQGYATRLATGFYAHPEKFDRLSGQTTVHAEDVHVWCEVCVDGVSWVTIEPTPGYLPPPEDLTLAQRISLAWYATLAWAKQRAALIAGVLGTVIAAWFLRTAWLDRMFTAFFWLAGHGSARRRLRATLQLLEWRAWLCGCPRPPRMTVRRYYADH
mgnify:CR=1 FL=1